MGGGRASTPQVCPRRKSGCREWPNLFCKHVAPSCFCPFCLQRQRALSNVPLTDLPVAVRETIRPVRWQMGRLLHSSKLSRLLFRETGEAWHSTLVNGAQGGLFVVCRKVKWRALRNHLSMAYSNRLLVQEFPEFVWSRNTQSRLCLWKRPGQQQLAITWNANSCGRRLAWRDGKPSDGGDTFFLVVVADMSI